MCLCQNITGHKAQQKANLEKKKIFVSAFMTANH